MDLLNRILKYKEDRGQDRNLEPYDQVVKVGVGWVDLEPLLLTICWAAKWVNILLDTLIYLWVIPIDFYFMHLYGLGTID